MFQFLNNIKKIEIELKEKSFSILNMSIYKELSFENDIELVKGVQFSVMSPKDIINKSVCEIVSTDTYSGNDPIIGGLFDSRMGVIDNDKICKTCHQKNTFCPGHFGHVVLSKPVFYIHFFDMVRKIMKCVCFRCSKLLINPQDPIVLKLLNKKTIGNRQKRFDLIYKCCSKIKRCGQENPNGCGCKLPHKITKENIGKINMEWKAEVNEEQKKQVLNAEDVLIILKRISDEDCDILGFQPDINKIEYNKPEFLICTVFPVPPPSVRPSVRNETGQRCEDDLTHKLCDIIKTNNTLKQKIGKDTNNAEQINYWSILLQFHIATFVDNQLPGIPPAKQRTGRPLRSLTERLKSKEGRVRGNLMGKRVDFSARSVITPDPNIDIDELGVPLKMATNLTFPEMVNQYNIKELTKIVKNGNDIYPGAKYIRKNEGTGYRTIRLKNLDTDTIVLKYGDIVDRHLMNGDVVLFNRQPSLHKMSMMAHRVRVMDYDTFRLNVCCTPSYNADYDGDEMNMHVPQSLQTENELLSLAYVPTQIISPRESAPIISVVQDIVVGLYRITKQNVFINNKQYFNILAGNSKFDGNPLKPSKVKNGTNIWTGRQLLSSVLHPLLDFAHRGITIENGIIIESEDKNKKVQPFDKKIYQEMTHGLIHSVYNDFGQDECKALFDNTQRLICDWLVFNGFSVGISDLIVEKETQSKLKHVIDDLKKNVYKTISAIHSNELENDTIMNNLENFENIVTQKLDAATKEINAIGTENINDSENRMMNMINSKSKGNPINVSQMMGSVGQQSVEGKRIMYGFDHRTLPHFTKYDDGPESRGFVESSFISGLTAQEFFFHAMGGREGLIDTAVKTSETGYIQRKLIKAMEDAKVNFDMTVRNASGNIVQFMYGDDSFDPIKLDKHHLDYLKYDITLEKMEENYLITESDNLKFVLEDAIITELTSNSNWTDRFVLYFKQILEDREYLFETVFRGKAEDTIVHPIEMNRLINRIRKLFCLDTMTKPSDLSPLAVLDEIENLTSHLTVCSQAVPIKMTQMVIRHYFSPKKLILKYNYTVEAFQYLVSSFKMKYQEAVVNPSEMVGVVAAQSIGEPSTQLTLNTFHLSGVASASKAVRGVPRIKELLSVSKNMKAPSCTIHLKDDITSYSGAEMVKNTIETTHLKDICSKSAIYFENSPDKSDILIDDMLIKSYKVYDDIDDDDFSLDSPWVLRFEIIKSKMLDRGLTTIDIYIALKKMYDDAISCMYCDDNSDSIVYRVSLTDSKTDDVISNLKALEYNMMEKIIIKGIQKIHKVSISQKKTKVLNDDVTFKTFIDSEKYVLETDGTNLRHVLINPYVDSTKTISNDVIEILQIFGIEAARQCLYNEIDDILNSTTSVNHRHISLLTDTMTSKGYLLSIDRHGINRSDIGPLAKCSFEETSDILIKAGIFGELDRIHGVSANIMLGQIAQSGTGDSQIIMDENKLLSIDGDDSTETATDEIDLTINECDLDFEYTFSESSEIVEEKTVKKIVIV